MNCSWILTDLFLTPLSLNYLRVKLLFGYDVMLTMSVFAQLRCLRGSTRVDVEQNGNLRFRRLVLLLILLVEWMGKSR